MILSLSSLPALIDIPTPSHTIPPSPHPPILTTSTAPFTVRSDKKTKKSKGHQCDEDDNDDTIEPVEVQEETATAAAAEEEGDDAAASSGRKRKRKRIRKLTKKGKEGENDDKDEDDEDGGRDDDASLPLRASSSISPTAAAPGTVYVEGISYQATEDDLIRFFQDKGCGKVKEVRMPRWQDSGRPRGYAHIEFKKGGEESVGKALALNGVSMMGRYLTVQMAQAPKGGGAAAVTPGKKPPGMFSNVGGGGGRLGGGGRGGGGGKGGRVCPDDDKNIKSLRSAIFLKNFIRVVK